MTERKAAFDVLMQIITEKSYSNIELNKRLAGLDRRAAGLVTNIVYGVLQNEMRIDYILKAYSKTPLKKMDPDILTILRMGIYQLIFTDKIPEYAAIDESVKMVKNKRLRGFVNAVLRSVARNDKEIKYPQNKKEFLSVYYSCPKWICEKWFDELGDEAESLIKTINTPPPLVLRVNTLKTSVEEFMHRRGGQPDGITKFGVVAEGGFDIAADEDYKNGLFYVQDSASMLPAEVLAPESGETVIDMCAAPGGKTTCMAQLMNNKGKIFAFDIYEHKLELINKTCQRLGVKIVETRLENAAEENEKFFETADKILVDAPCSGLGIIRRKPEIRYERTGDDIDKIIEIQKNILDVSAKYLKPGGRLVYSTCTLNKDENENVIAEFLKRHDNYETEDFYINKEKSKNGSLRLMPHIHGTDGFFIASLKRVR